MKRCLDCRDGIHCTVCGCCSPFLSRPTDHEFGSQG